MSLTTWLANDPCLHTPSTGVTSLGHPLWLFSYGQWEWIPGPHACSTGTLATDPSPQPSDLGENQKKPYCRPTMGHGGRQHWASSEASHRWKAITSQQTSSRAVLKCHCFSQEELWKRSGYLLRSHTLPAHPPQPHTGSHVASTALA